jgi:ribose transport system permease protein
LEGEQLMAGDSASAPEKTAERGEDRSTASVPFLARVRPEYVLVVFLALLILVFAVRSPFFLAFGNFRNILLSVAVLGILAVPSTLLLVSANVDLSVASTAALCGMVVAIVGNEYGFALGVLAGLAVGLVLGAINGALVSWIGINAIITTLGTLSIYRGAAKLMSNGQTVRVDGFAALGSGSTLGIPNAVLLLVLVALLFSFLMRYTVYGRGIYALGSNEQAARLSGIRIRLNLFVAFVMTGLCGGIAGMILTSQLRAAAPIAGLGLELSVVAAVLLGGASLTGGRGTIIGTLLGVLILGTLNNGLTILNVSSFWQEIARGAVLIVAVGGDQLRVRFSGE